MIPGLGENAVLDSYVLLQFDLVQSRLQIITDGGDVFAVPCTHIGNVNHSSQIEEDFMEAEAEMQHLPDNQLNPEEATLCGHISDTVAVGARTITSIEAEILVAEAPRAPVLEW